MRTRFVGLLAIALAALSTTCAQSRFTARSAEAPPAAAKQGLAKSVILFIGDGMGPEIVSVANVYAEESLEAGLNMVALANTGTTGYATTGSADKLVTDSAASGTALATGQKTNNGIIGYSAEGLILENLLELAVEDGKSVGVITTSNVTDATPGAFLAHVASRENQFEVASQIVDGDASVVMGGGAVYFLPLDRGKRPDGRDLVAEARRQGWEVVFNRDELRASGGERLLGLFNPEFMPFERERRTYESPSVSEMLEKALGILTADADGFVLVVEGGRIDHAEHDNDVGDAIAELLAFDDAIGQAMEYQDEDSELTIVVTADHDTGGPAITSTGYGYPSHDDLEAVIADTCAFIAWASRGHTNTMVPLFARGPGAYKFAGVRDNTDVFKTVVWILGL